MPPVTTITWEPRNFVAGQPSLPLTSDLGVNSKARLRGCSLTFPTTYFSSLLALDFVNILTLAAFGRRVGETEPTLCLGLCPSLRATHPVQGTVGRLRVRGMNAGWVLAEGRLPDGPTAIALDLANSFLIWPHFSLSTEYPACGVAHSTTLHSSLQGPF